MAPKKTVTNKNDKGRRMEANIVRRIVKREQKTRMQAGRICQPTERRRRKRSKPSFSSAGLSLERAAEKNNQHKANCYFFYSEETDHYHPFST